MIDEVCERVKGTRLADGENSTQYSFYNGKSLAKKNHYKWQLFMLK